MKAINQTSGRELAATLLVAETLFSRTRGLLGMRALPRGQGLLIRPCKGVHTFFMRFPIDVVFLDRNNRVVGAVQNLQPQRISKVVFSSAGVIELPAGTLAATETEIGHEVMFL